MSSKERVPLEIFLRLKFKGFNEASLFSFQCNVMRCRNSSIRNSCSIRLCLRDFFVAKTLDPGGAKSLGLVIRAGNKACAPGVISLVSTACSKSQLEEARSECEKHFGDAAGILAVYSSHRMASLHVLL